MVMSLLHTHAPPGRMGEAAGVRMSLVQAMAVAVPLTFGDARRDDRPHAGVLVGRRVPRDRRLAVQAGDMRGCQPTRRRPRSLPRPMPGPGGQAPRFSRSANDLRNLATFGATTNMQYGCAGLRSK